MTTKHSVQDFALLGGPSLFEQPVHVGQLRFPSWERYEAAMRGIFERQYYTNHGALAQQFEARLAEFLQVKHAIAVTNATLGLIMAVKALGLTGKVIVPSFTFIASAQSLTWAGAEPVFCDVDPSTCQMSLRQVRESLERETGIEAIMGVNLWGGSCDPKALESIAAEYGVELYFDSAHAFGCTIDGAPIGRFGRLEVFSFHATDVLSTTEGGCITTNDDALAARLRNIRSSYGAGPPTEVPLTSNGRFSEAQAAIGLLNLETFSDALANNRASCAVSGDCRGACAPRRANQLAIPGLPDRRANLRDVARRTACRAESRKRQRAPLFLPGHSPERAVRERFPAIRRRLARNRPPVRELDATADRRVGAAREDRGDLRPDRRCPVPCGIDFA